MKGVVIILLISTVYVKFHTSCPALSCIMCSDDITICYKLSSILAVPETTKAMMLTDGLITLVDNGSLSEVSNLTLLRLSNNAISRIMENAFQTLKHLRILLLDHNHMTSGSIPDSAFVQLQSLEILHLGNNALQSINSNWFQSMRNLLALQLEGNLITKLSSGTFKSASLNKLESLDLSDNLIEFLAKGSFYGLPQLRRLDLSRNSLRSAPDAFSYLSWLSALNLDFNQWNCTCELQELASFLTSYMQAPDKVLYNGRQLICLSTANPAVQTMLQLTEANCVPPNQNITVLVKARSSISLERYARDVSLAACLFFAGGVGLTIAVLYIIYCKLTKRKSLMSWRERKCGNEEAAGTGAIRKSGGTPQCNFTEDRNVQILTITHPGQEAKARFPNQERQMGLKGSVRERGLPKTALARPEHCFSCYKCSPAGASLVKDHIWTEGNHSESLSHPLGLVTTREAWLKLNEEVQNHHERSKIEHQMSNNRGDFMYQHQNSGQTEEDYGSQFSMSHWDKPKQTLLNAKRTAHGSNRDLHDRSKFQSIPTLPECFTTSCVHCQKAYNRLSSHQDRSRTEHNITHPLFSERPSNRVTNLYSENSLRNMNDHAGLEVPGSDDQMRAPRSHLQLQRNVTFNLTDSNMHVLTVPHKKKLWDTASSHRLNTWDRELFQNKNIMQPSNNKMLKDDKRVKRDQKDQRNPRKGLLKVKINLNPLKKIQVHPNKKKELPSGEKDLGRAEKCKNSRNVHEETRSLSEARGPVTLADVQDNSRKKPAKRRAGFESMLSRAHHLKNAHEKSASKGKSPRVKDEINKGCARVPEHSDKEPVRMVSNEIEVKHTTKNRQVPKALSENFTTERQTGAIKSEQHAAGIHPAESNKRDDLQEASGSEYHQEGLESQRAGEILNREAEGRVEGPREAEEDMDQPLSSDLSQSYSCVLHALPKSPPQSYTSSNPDGVSTANEEQKKELMPGDPDFALEALKPLPQDGNTDMLANQKTGQTTDPITPEATADGRKPSMVMDGTQSTSSLESVGAVALSPPGSAGPARLQSDGTETTSTLP